LTWNHGFRDGSTQRHAKVIGVWLGLLIFITDGPRSP